MNVLYLNSSKQDILTKHDYLLRAAKRLGFKNVISYEGQENPEYVLNIQPYHTCFVKGSKWTGVWEIDCLVKRFRMTRYWQRVDTIFVANFIEPVDLIDNVHVLFQACDLELYKKKIKPKYDFVLIGTTTDDSYARDLTGKNLDIYTERMRCVNLLKEKYTFNLIEAPWKHRLPIQEYINQLQLGKVQFIRSMEVDGKGEIAQRFFECLAIGPVLTNYTEDLDKLDLVEGRDYLAYKNDKEMLSKMHLLINKPQYAHSIAHKGRQKAFMFHSFDNRLISILNF